MSRKSRPLKHEYSIGAREQAPFESDVDYLKALTRQANARMTRIENITDSRYTSMKKYAYRNAMYDIKHIEGEDATRFSADVPLTKTGAVNMQELHRRTNAVKRFLDAPSSTITGIKEVYEQRARTTNRRYGYEIGEDGKRHKNADWQNLTWEDMANYYDSEMHEQNDKKYGSKTEVRALGAIKRIANDKDKIQAAIDGNFKLSNNEGINKAAVEMLQNGLDPSRVYTSWENKAK